MRKINYDKSPSTIVKGYDQEIQRGYSEIAKTLKSKFKSDKTIVTVDCSDGVYVDEIVNGLSSLNFDLIIKSASIFISPEAMNDKVYRYLTDDRVFAIAYTGKWLDFVDPKALEAVREIVNGTHGRILIVGVGGLGSPAALYLAVIALFVLCPSPRPFTELMLDRDTYRGVSQRLLPGETWFPGFLRRVAPASLLDR